MSVGGVSGRVKMESFVLLFFFSQFYGLFLVRAFCEPPDFFADLVAGIFLLIFVGKVPNSSKIDRRQSLTYFCRVAGPIYRVFT